MLERSNNFRTVADDHWKQPSRALLRKAHRAEALPGFPVTVAFATMEDILSYTSGERLQCLICGKMFKSVGAHIVAQHGVPPSEYRYKYGIPGNVSLSCGSTKTLKSTLAVKRLEDPVLLGNARANLAKGREVTLKSKPAHRPFSPVTISAMIARVETSLRGRSFDCCSSCGVRDGRITHVPHKCVSCKKPESRERRREISLKHYYANIEHSRDLLRERARKRREILARNRPILTP